MTAHVWVEPAEIAATPPVSPTTSTGGQNIPQARPSPSWPNSLLPQHFTPLAVVNAQVWL
jgi:hypothetical protein